MRGGARVHDRLDIGVAVHGIVPRLALVLVVGAAMLVLQAAPFLQFTAGILALCGAVLPRTGAAWLSLVVLAFALVLAPVELGRTCVAIAAVHLGHLLATMSLTIPLTSRIALKALKPAALRAIVVQGVSQALALFALAIPVADGPGLAWAAPVGAVAVALIAVLLLRRMR